MPQEISFDTSSGIDLVGWWSNPSTGESYQVVDQFFQDNSLYVKTAQGQIINFNRIQNFVRSDNPITRPPDRMEPVKKSNPRLLEGLEGDTPESISDILQEDMDLIYGRKKVEDTQKQPEKSVNSVIMDQMFSKAPAPDVEVRLKWEWDKLDGTMRTLVDTMDIPVEEVVDYIVEKYSAGMYERLNEKLREVLMSVD